jgi:hypothetical protein
LKGTLSSIPRGNEARVSHPMMGFGAFHPGYCGYCKSSRAPCYTYYQKAQGQPPHEMGASISAIPFFPRPRSSKKITVQGTSGKPLECYFTQPLVCSWGDFHFCHSFLSQKHLFLCQGKTFYLNWEYSSFYSQESTFACP